MSKYILIFLFCLTSIFTFSQKSTDKLKKEQERLEKNISSTKNLLDKTKINTEATLNELKLIDNQVKYREELLLNFDNQIRGTELKIEQKNNQIEDLQTKLMQLQKQYKKLFIYAYKKRSKEAKMMYIFSSNSYYEALKRKKYLEKIAEIQRKQRLIILQSKKLIAKEKNALVQEKSYKEKIADEKRIEKQEILKDKEVQTKTLVKLKNEEQKLVAQIQKDEAKKNKIKGQIDSAIANELAALEKKNKKKYAETKSNTGTKKPKTPTGTNKPKTPEKTTPVLTEPKEVALNQSFETNKGRLPWPVSSGSITESYGKNAHPTVPNVFTNNNGIDISATKGAQVRAVYDGEVSSVLSIPGAGKVVIIKHGNYRTVYSNLQDSYVTVGSKISTKQAIGSLMIQDGESLSIAHFEIHQVVGNSVTRMNPSLWITR
ncbi:MAG: peptidoglycan DD-metalloendopeptidase family protein [Bacteroidota bacterium]